MHYTLGVWLMFFYIYCFLGWCYESTYVSILQKRLVNRGFLTGPMLPIYGSGALVILLSTLWVRESYILTFLVGMAAATALEYVTGWAMEALFKVRYWDYSHKKLNVKGYICLTSSLARGAMSVLLVNLMHRPIESLVMGMDTGARNICVLILSVVFTADVTHSIMAAMDIKMLLKWLDSAKGDVKKLQARIDDLESRLTDELSQRREQLLGGVKTSAAQLTQDLDALKARREQLGEWLSQRLSWSKRRMIMDNPDVSSPFYQDALDKVKEWIKSKKL